MVRAKLRNERGVALLAVLMGIALMTLIVVDFAMSAGLGFVSAANQANELRSYYLARSAVNVGLALLAQDTRLDAQSQTPFDSLEDPWAVPFPPIPVDGGVVALSIVDETRKLSVNSLVDTDGKINQPAMQRMTRLFSILGINPEVLAAIVDWIDPDNIESPGGAEADYYMGLRPPYQPRNGPMPTIGDLKMVKGINEAAFNRLRPFLTVMPENQINANTAQAEVLASLADELMEDPKIVQAIIEARAVRPFENVTDVTNIPEVGAIGSKLTQGLTTRSQYFTITGVGSFAGARKMITATFHREQAGNGTLASWQEE
jgi:general secretion pathway protein K